MDINSSYFRLLIGYDVLGLSISNSDIGPHIHHHTFSYREQISIGRHPRLIDENIQYIKR